MTQYIKTNRFPLLLAMLVVMLTACSDQLDQPELNNNFAGGTDFSKTDDMIFSLIGAYQAVSDRGWEQPLVVSTRGDDVNAAGDQQGLKNQDRYVYDNSFFGSRTLWETYYGDIIRAHTAMEQIERYMEFADADGIDKGNQYIAEIKVLRSILLFQLSQVYGAVFIPESSDLDAFADVTSVPTKDEVMQHISDQMDGAISFLPDMRPNERTDLPGGVTKYTALMVKAVANQELKNYQEVADAAGQIISSGKFSLFNDFYELFKTPGKLSDESLFEFQYSDFGTGEGERVGHLYAPYGPNSWTPTVAGASNGWGFFEPSMKYVTFMLDRGETERLETSVFFSQKGIDSLIATTSYTAETLPAFVSPTTRDGDINTSTVRSIFSSGKHYLPTNQLISGRTEYGSNKNYIVFRYAETLLIYAEALLQGASNSAMTAEQAVNLVRGRAGMDPLSGVTLDQVIDEKYAELSMEWGKRFFDMVRLGRNEELSYEGRTFTANKAFVTYHQDQIDEFPILGEISN
ncbi:MULTISPECIES: RagB/SusD family nutrient uptake outer membrane protein [unclassified Arenibacter]|uniref:RagB/SusD family nutrient uptake outer membrane protein n=1 Tax=unclassified Arenibacter TaxID=2615047 RepID=UPI000E3523D3|nr:MULTISPECIES: RagB/SusD family nutrient uptake outer membrane protein [unclassified Arenibacter]MCM4165399.1 RagB/SusD family nutrient uptake outer membrane protein [Arenibacter sp. A80]RFT54875.1 RagB/SusD family nutrient uptake outer membrane protein [Arenibacter sp. P308M17]